MRNWVGMGLFCALYLGCTSSDTQSVTPDVDGPVGEPPPPPPMDAPPIDAPPIDAPAADAPPPPLPKGTPSPLPGLVILGKGTEFLDASSDQGGNLWAV